MVEPNIYCKVSGAVVSCVHELNCIGRPLPTVIEIGCADGQGTMRFAGLCGRVICVDPMAFGRPDFLLGSKPEVDDGTLQNFYRRTCDFNVHLIVGLSLDQAVIDNVRNLLNGNLVDILIIDGCHHPLDAVWADFTTYYQFVKGGGFVIFDDLYELEDILPAYERAIADYDMEEFFRWRSNDPDVLQEVGALRKR